MALQSPSTLNPSPNAGQAQALYALANMQQAAQAADTRVQAATDETFKQMQRALQQSESNNKTLSELLSQALQKIEVLSKRVDTLESLRKNEKTAIEENMNALKLRVKSSEDNIRIIKSNLDTAKSNFANHNHVDGYTGSCHVTCAPRIPLY